jgi:hypothetical protein
MAFVYGDILKNKIFNTNPYTVDYFIEAVHGEEFCVSRRTSQAPLLN